MLTYTNVMDVRYDVDVFVAGGGPAGVAAAVTAARNGASVYLAEAMGCFGGEGTSALVPCFCQFSDGERFLAGGIGEEICLAHYGNEAGADGFWALDCEKLKRQYDRMVSDAGVQFTFFTTLLDVVTDAPGHVEYAVCAGKSGVFAVRAKYFLDCTGDADLCARAGADFELGDENGLCMGATLCSTWAGVEWDRVTQAGGGEPLERAIRDGVFKIPDRHLPGMLHCGKTYAGGNIGHIFGVDGTDERSLTAAMLEGRRYYPEYEKYYKEYLTGFESMELTATGSLLGVRESRRVTGDYRLTLDDFLARRKFADDIGVYCYPVDIHVGRPGLDEYARFEDEYENLRYRPGKSYGIPFRVLTPKGLTNVMVAGRSISTDRAMQSSTRVMPCCYITGQAIGMAAAMHPDDVHAADIPALQERLRKIGAII